MIEYEYLYFPTRISGYDCSQLTKANMGWMFDIHRRVITKLDEMLPNALNELRRKLLLNGIDAFNVRMEFVTEKKVNGMSKESVFERLLSESICRLCYGQEHSFQVNETFCSLSIFPVDANGERITYQITRISNEINMTDVPQIERITSFSGALTRSNEACESSSPMKENPRKKVASQTIQSDSPVFQDLILSPPEDKVALRLRDKLSEVIRGLSVLETQTSENEKLLALATKLNSTFIESVDHRLRPMIEPIERDINERLSNLEPSTLPQKQEFAKAVNAELRSLGLAIRCPKTNRPSILVADPSSHPSNGRFQLQHKGLDDKPKRSFSTVNLKNITLMPDISSFDIELASILSKLPSQRILTSATN